MENSNETKNMETKIDEQKESIWKKPWVQSVSGIVIILLVAGGVLLYKSMSSNIKIENSLISAPVISISPESEGIIEEVYVKVGDMVTPNQPLARVGAEVLTAKIAGLVTAVSNTPGQVFQPISSAPVVQMIDPNEFRVVGSIKENEGLADIKIGQLATFTVDAFPGKTFTGVVDSIGATSKQSGVTFSISDKREQKEFEIKLKYDVAANPLFRNGMSAKINIFKKS
ncbi:efflux RND transporter periplasmic adaptor subunit [Patescibacteria group bacterium]|nr:efflux RND transporter periplasmic adaptor subunit [Patescibacteria group bacterium]